MVFMVYLIIMTKIHFFKRALCVLFYSTTVFVQANEPVEIFPAKQDLWKQCGPGSFSIKDGVATSQGGMGMWWYSGSDYGNATFDIEVSLPNTNWNSGVFVRFPDPKNDPWIAIRKGYECQISGDKADKISTGAIYDTQKPSHDMLKKPGEWNKYQITTWNNKIIIVINGELVNVFTTTAGRGDKRGHIGLQNHDNDSKVNFRKVTVTEWGKDLTLSQTLDKIGLTRADWAKYHAKNNPDAKWHDKMDIGPVWANIFEDHYLGVDRLAALKGLTLDLSHADSIKGLFDTETLRMSSAFEGRIIYDGTPWTGRHEGITRMDNLKKPIMQTAVKPGWADKGGSFEDNREHRGHGNLALDHARFNGHFRNGSQVILDYSVHGSRVLELPTAGNYDHFPLVFRQLDLAPSETARTMLVNDFKNAKVSISDDGKQAMISTGFDEKPKAPAEVPGKVSVVVDATKGDWNTLSMGAPSDSDAVDRKNSKKAYFRAISKPGEFAEIHKQGGDEEGVAFRLNDGLASRNDDDLGRSFFFDDTQLQGRLEVHLEDKSDISRIHLYSNHISDRAPQDVEIYGSVAETSDSELETKDLEKGGWTKIASYKTRDMGKGGKHGAAILSPKGKSIGKYHKLLFVCNAPDGRNQHTFFSEIDVYFDKAPVLAPLASLSKKSNSFFVQLKDNKGLKFSDGGNGTLLLKIPASAKPTRFSLGYGASDAAKGKQVMVALKSATPVPRELKSLTEGGSSLYPEVEILSGKLGTDDATWVVDTITLPVTNRWNSMIKPGGLDFFSDGDSAALSTWNGDVWIVTGLKGDWKELKWRRFATGLYETLGLKIVDDVVYVNGRDQITRLHDQNNDGEADWYENFNNDVLVTSNFHEFTFELQTDEVGNFYIVKGAPVLSGGRGFDKILPHNGTMLRISKDGKKMDVIATGLRAPGGMAVGPNGEFTTGENEGSWQPCCKLNYFTGSGKFLGVEDAAHFLEGQEMHLPLCYLPMKTDNSGGSQVWVPENADWGLKAGELIHLSYGKSSLYRVLKQEVDGIMQGGVVRIPVSFDSSAMRARYHEDGSLYMLGFRGWQTNAATEQAFHRVRYSGKKISIPDELKVTDKGIYVKFEQKLDPAIASDRFAFKLERWKYIRSMQYGSGHYSIDNPDLEAENRAYLQETHSHRKHDVVEVASATLLSDGMTVFLQIPDMKPAEQMSIVYNLKFADGSPAVGEIVNTVHNLAIHEDNSILKETAASEDAPKNLKPGLHQVIKVKGKTDHRISRLAAQFVGEGDNISDMLPAGNGKEPFESSWQGYLVLKERITPQFQLLGKGTATLKINGKIVAKLGDKPGESQQLNPGMHKFELHYKSEQNGKGDIRTMWQTDATRQHTIPSKYFQHQTSEHLIGSLDIRHGRDLVMKQNCIQCHTNDIKDDTMLPELKEMGPNMKGIGSRVSDQWLAQWLATPHKLKPGTSMPAFVDASTKQGRKDAADMAAYLASLKGDQSPKVAIKADDVKMGGNHFHQLGCVACHSLPNNAHDEALGNIPLNNTNNKYTPESLVSFLKKPNKHHKAIKMPDFQLSDDEARQLAAYVHKASEGKQTAPVENIGKGDVTRGKQLITQHNCASCHEGLPSGGGELPDFSSILGKSWAKHGGHGNKSPKLNISEDESKLLEAYRVAVAGDSVDVNSTLTSQSSHDYSERQFTALNCASCHSRDDQPSLLASLHSKSEYLTKGIPQDANHKVDQSRPHMTYIGEMLHTDYLQGMLDGTVSPRPRPWLAMRMPAFESRAALLAKGLTAQHGLAPSKADFKNIDEQKAKIGEKIIGANGGFACTICHANGDAKALAAFEVEGINFDQVGKRLRKGFYHQWMDDPTTITPTTKMPRYTTNNKSPLPDYDNDANKQFDAVYEYLRSISKDK